MNRLDPLTELGIGLKREIPVGERLVDWLLDGHGLPPFADTLRATPFSWPEIAVAVHDLTRGMWSPTPPYLYELYKGQGGTGEFSEAVSE